MRRAKKVYKVYIHDIRKVIKLPKTMKPEIPIFTEFHCQIDLK